MNERIKELAEQVYGSAHHDDFKFAELIIQKCKNQLALIGITNFENKDITWTVETAIVNIEEHFGVSDDQ